MTKHYSIDEAKKIIYADILALTAKEEAEVEKFVKFGFTVENKKADSKAKVERLNDPYILEYLKDDAEALATYAGLKNEVATDENGKTKTTSKGNAKKKGFNAGRNWFAKTYPADASTLDEEIEKAGLKKQFAELWKAYAEQNKDVKGAMTADEYKRDFYWKKVFVRPAKK